MGGDSLEPFLAACSDGAGVFVLTRTSNPGGADIQEQPLADGRPVWERTAELIAAWGAPYVGSSGLSGVGAVVGATQPGGRRPGPRSDAERRSCCCRASAPRAAARSCWLPRSATIRPAASWWRRAR